MQSQNTNTSTNTKGSTFANIKEKIKHPMTHDTETGITYQTKEQKKLAEKDPRLANELGPNKSGVPPSSNINQSGSSNTTASGVSSEDSMLNQPNVPSTHSTSSREEYQEDSKW